MTGRSTTGIVEPVDPQEVAELIEAFQHLDDDTYAARLGDTLVTPDPVEVAAFRSPELCERSLIAVRFAITRARKRLLDPRLVADKARTDPGWSSRVQNFLSYANRERETLERAVDGVRAQQGLPPRNSPNLRRQAMKILWERHYDEGRDIERDLREKQKAAANAQRKTTRRR